jgi:thiol-disulfide isomerase/thioredoxin
MGILLSAGPGCSPPTTPTSQDTRASLEGDAGVCAGQLGRIHAAIQAYRRDAKDLPNSLADLVPKYLGDKEALICPLTKRTGQTHTFDHLKDPKLPAAYLYEFTPMPMGNVWAGGEIRMRDFKRRQMGLVGGKVPIVRCHLHQPVLNLAFDGEVYTSGLGWEDNFSDVVDPSAWQMSSLFPDAPRAPQPQPAAETPPRNELEGRPAPEFSLPLLEEGTFELAAHKGKNIVLLDFWASWCGPCRVVMPTLVEIARDYAGKGVRYVAVNLREEPAVIRRYLEDARLKLDVPLDKDAGVGRKYGVTAIPTMVVIDKKGIVAKVHVGSSPNLKAELTGMLDGLVNREEAEAADKPPSASNPPRN